MAELTFVPAEVVRPFVEVCLGVLFANFPALPHHLAVYHMA